MPESFHIDAADLPRESVIFGRTAAMRDVRASIDAILHVDTPVLIQGETGTGKELVAKFLHSRSDRREGPFLKLNCGAAASEALEQELFGYESGSSQGTNATTAGAVELAERGTLFLVEIAEMESMLQSKLLQLMQKGTYCRVGGREQRRADVRVICGHETDRAGAVNEGRSREDQFSVETTRLRLLALRDRKEDIPELWDFFAHELARKFRKNAPQLTPAVLQLLQEWNWPGNLREFENGVARVIILGDERALAAELRRQMALAGRNGKQESEPADLRATDPQTSSRAAEAAILKVLRANHWNKRKTAEDLKMSYRSLLSKLRDAGGPRRRRGHRDFPPLP
jgi:two-component system, NtrC family, response regulator AtoC